MKFIPKLSLTIVLLIVSNIYSYADNVGFIKGNLLVNDTWESTVYLSKIFDFDEMYSITNEMISTQATIDSLGNFQISLDFLPKEEILLRIHLVKKGNPPASLIVGSSFENHFFIVADKNSKINIQNTDSNSIFSNVFVSGSPSTNNFNLISALSRFPDIFDYEDELLKKEFVQKVANERLRFIADTCNNPLISLYALFKSDFEEDFTKSPDFYENYLKKWKNYESSYYTSFRKLVPDNKFPLNSLMVTLAFIIVTIGFIFYKFKIYGDKTKKLSVQERRIFELIKQGATNQDISNEIHIELSTVKTHVSNIFSKLKIKSRKEIMNMK